MQDAYQHGVSSWLSGVACGRTTLTQPPHITILLTDQQKARALRLDNAFGIPAPASERLAARGVRYEGCDTPHPLCVPARVSLWTGRYPRRHGARTNEIPMPVLAVWNIRSG